jgi:hypothetical protein
MRTAMILSSFVGVVLAAPSFLCEPAFKKTFCPLAVNEDTSKCLTCAFDKFEEMKGLGCNKDIIQTACNATNEEWKVAVAPYMERTNTDCRTHDGNCADCLHDESVYTHECYFCYQDRRCYGVGGSSNEEGCDDDVGNYACTSLSDYSGCHCPAHDKGQDDDGFETCDQQRCPPPGSKNLECEFCEQIVGYMLSQGGQAACDGLCVACCEEIPIVGPETCDLVLQVTGGCAAIEAAIESAAGLGQCGVCKSLGACSSCGSSADDDAADDDAADDDPHDDDYDDDSADDDGDDDDDGHKHKRFSNSTKQRGHKHKHFSNSTKQRGGHKHKHFSNSTKQRGGHKHKRDPNSTKQRAKREE